MAELRKNYLSGEWVSIAVERGQRPQPLRNIVNERTLEKRDCPFCLENKHMVTDSIYNSDDGRVRVIPNLFPALSTQNLLGYGFHEVLIDTPNHNESLHEFPVENIANVLDSIKKRIELYSQNKQVLYVQVFKNCGYESGATMAHSHWQIITMPLIPRKQEAIYENSKSYYMEKDSCYLCDLIHKIDELTVFENHRSLAYTPFASLFPYCINIMPKKHYSDFKDIDSESMRDMAECLKKSLMALYKIFPNLSYNICFQNMPYVDSIRTGTDYSHFYMQIIPRLSNFAGFELSTGCYINSVLPEVAAEDLFNAINS